MWAEGSTTSLRLSFLNFKTGQTARSFAELERLDARVCGKCEQDGWDAVGGQEVRFLFPQLHSPRKRQRQPPTPQPWLVDSPDPPSSTLPRASHLGSKLPSLTSGTPQASLPAPFSAISLFIYFLFYSIN